MSYNTHKSKDAPKYRRKIVKCYLSES